MIPDGRVGDSGKILVFDPPRRLSMTWRNEFVPEMKAEGHSPDGCSVRLMHEMDEQWAAFVDTARGAWEKMLGVLATLV